MGAWSPEWTGQHQTLASYCVLSELDTSLPLCFAQPSSIDGNGKLSGMHTLITEGGGGGVGEECGRGNKLGRASIPYWSLCFI